MEINERPNFNPFKGRKESSPDPRSEMPKHRANPGFQIKPKGKEHRTHMEDKAEQPGSSRLKKQPSKDRIIEEIYDSLPGYEIRTLGTPVQVAAWSTDVQKQKYNHALLLKISLDSPLHVV